MNKIAIQGIKGAFHEKAAKKHFKGEEISVLECDTFKEVCEAVKEERSNYAMMAIENTIAGSLLSNYELIKDHQLKIVGEVYLKITMNLMALPGVGMDDIKVVESHPIALQQCKEFLYSRMDVIHRESYDTAGAAKDLQTSGRKDLGVIAAEDCAEIYGLELLEKGIETNKQNFTRFLVLSKDEEVKEPNKTSLSFQVKHKSGSLVEILAIFEEFDLNLTKIQSVPIIGLPYQYNFHVDVEWSDRNKYNAALQKLLQKAVTVSLLGEYKKSDYRNE